MKNNRLHVTPSVSAALKAMQNGKRLSLLYHPQGKENEQRIVEVHAVGISVAGRPCMRVWQVQGGAVFGEHTGWKMLSFEDVDNVVILDDKSEGPRPGFSPGDKGMSAILAEISNEPVPKEAAT